MRNRRMRFHIFWLSVLSAMSGSAVAFLQETPPSDLLQAVDELVSQTAKIRGLEPKEPLRKGVKSRQEISEYLQEHVRKDFNEGELPRQGKVLKKLGLIPASIDYGNFILQLLTEQVGGYFDTDRKTLFIAGWLPSQQQTMVLVHELTHALQDQHFDVGRRLEDDRKRQNDDLMLAHQAVIEGDAVAVMLNYLLEPTGRDFSRLPDLTGVMRAQFASADAQYPVFKSAPLYLRESLLFPYGYGAGFIQKVWGRSQSWREIDKLYSDLPASTEQIMHPEKYMGVRDEPRTVPAAKPEETAGPGWETTYDNVLGEFSLLLMLRLYLPEEEAQKAAAGWGGDRIRLLENEAQKLDAVIDDSVWDSTEDAGEFYAALTQWCTLRYPDAVRSNKSSDHRFSVSGEREFCQASRSGTAVRLILGTPESGFGSGSANRR